jgi:hypothetical protein
MDRRIAIRYNANRRRHPEIRGKRVDWISYSIEEGELYVSVRFIDKTAFHLQVKAEIWVNRVELSDWKTGDEKVLRTYQRRRPG